MDAIIVDLDGTLCNNDHRRHLIEGTPKDWDWFNRLCYKDTVNEWCAELIARFADTHEILFVSGRNEAYRDLTVRWLDENGFCCPSLFMRQNNDFRKDSEVKQEIYNTHIKGKFNVLFCVDDRKQVVDMWRANGLVCLQCAEGNF
jgi:hypothetical protein